MGLGLVLLAALQLAPSASLAPLRSQPAVQRAWADRASYQPRPGRLSTDAIRGHDVLQGVAGTCYFLSPLAGLARAQPKLLRSAIRKHPDGTVSVRFYRRSRTTGRQEPVRVRVDRTLPRFDNGTPLNARSPDDRELWVSIVEKAYAKFKRQEGYHGIGEGGFAGAAMTALTGKPSRTLFLAELSSDRLFQTLRSSLDRGKVAIAGTYTSAEFRHAGSRDRIRKAGPVGMLRRLGALDRPSYTGTGLHPGHAYTVWGLSEARGTRYVHLRDPYGYKAPRKGAPSSERKRGIFKITLTEFQHLYEDLHIGG